MTTSAQQPQEAAPPATTLADVARLRSQRITVHSPEDVHTVGETAALIKADLDANPGASGRPVAKAVALAAVVVVIAAVVAFLLLAAGMGLVGSLSDGA